MTKSEGDTINESEMQEDRMFNIFKVVEKALDAIAHDVKQIHFEAGHLEVKAKVSVSGKVYDATLTIDEEAPVTGDRGECGTTV